MKSAGLFVLQSGKSMRECDWLCRKMAEVLPNLAAVGPVAAETPLRLLDNLALHIEQCDIFVVAAELRQYHALKKQLLEALELPVEADESIAAQQSKYPQDMMFPRGAVVFASQDACYNGFAMRCGRQHMLVLPLRMDLLAFFEAKTTQYLQRAAGSNVIPMAAQPQSVDAVFASLCGYAGDAPIEPEAIVPFTPAPRPRAAVIDRQSAAQGKALLEQLTERGLTCDLLLPPAWAGAAQFLSGLGGGVVSPVMLGDKYTAQDISYQVARHMRKTGCRFCAMLAPSPQDEAGAPSAVLALAGPEDYACMRRIEIGGQEDPSPALALALLELLRDYRDPAQKRVYYRRARRAIVMGLAVAVLALGLPRLPLQPTSGKVVEEVSYVQTQAGIAEADLLRAQQGAQQAQDALASGLQVLAAGNVQQSAAAAGTWNVEQMFAKLAQVFLKVMKGAAKVIASLPEIIPTTTKATTVTKATTATKDATTTAKATTTVRPTTTIKATTTAKPTTTIKATTTAKPTTTVKAASQGVYTFTVVGFGHGVGLSQEGAKALAAQGWSCEKIIKHYYNASGIAISSDASRPASVTHGGARYNLKEYLARIAYAEIGRCGLVADEAIKAQMICAYTIAKRSGFTTTDTNQKLLPAADWNSNFAKQYHAKMLALAESVLGKYITYNGSTANALYFSSCAGYTASSQYAWSGSTPPPYLTGGRTSPEAKDRSTATFTTDQIKALVKTYNSKYPSNAITLGSDAAQWMKVLRTDSYGYVEQFQIGNRVLTGGDARNKFFTARTLRSHNFKLSFAAK